MITVVQKTRQTKMPICAACSAEEEMSYVSLPSSLVVWQQILLYCKRQQIEKSLADIKHKMDLLQVAQ